MRRRLGRLLLFLCVVSPQGAAATDQATPQAGATNGLVATVGRLWGQVKFFHPWLRYKSTDWDAALVTALPRIRAAATDDAFAAAVGELLSALGDPLTRVERVPAPAPKSLPAAASATPLFHWEGKVLVVTLSGVPTAMEKDRYGFGQPLKLELAKAEAVVVDARLGGAERRLGRVRLRFLRSSSSRRVRSRDRRAGPCC